VQRINDRIATLVRLSRFAWYAIGHRRRCNSPWVATPVRGLRGHDASGGHTITRHVDISIPDLRMRLITEGIQRASRFWDLSAAQAAVNYAVTLHFEPIFDWLVAGQLNRFTLSVPAPGSTCIGFSVARNADGFEYARTIRIVLERLGNSFYILTAYPEP
jgi:hypothetical protein